MITQASLENVEFFCNTEGSFKCYFNYIVTVSILYFFILLRFSFYLCFFVNLEKSIRKFLEVLKFIKKLCTITYWSFLK